VTHDDAGNLTGRGAYTYHYNVLGKMVSVDENTTNVASMSYDATGSLAKMVEGGEERYLITEDFEWLKTSGLGRIQIRLAGTVIASHEVTYPTGGGGGGCGASLPAVDGDWRAPLGLLAPGLWAFMLLQVGFALRRRPRGERLRPVLAGGTAGVFLVATSVPLPGIVPEARAAVTPTGVTYYHGDHLGSSAVITNETGTEVRQVLYGPFGQAAAGSAEVPEFGFTGQRYVDSLGVYDYGARWYDPELGRFMQADPLVRESSNVPDTSNPQTVNPYSYVLNNPLTMVDPTGEAPLPFEQDYGSTSSFYPYGYGDGFSSFGYDASLSSLYPSSYYGSYSGLSSYSYYGNSAGFGLSLSQGTPIADLQIGDDFTGPEVWQVQAANRSGLLGAALGKEFASTQLEDLVVLVRNANLGVPAQWSPAMGSHRIALRPDAFSHPGDFLATFGHELHHAFRFEHVTNAGLPYDLGTMAGRAAFEIPAIRFEQQYLFGGTTPGYQARTLEDLRIWLGRQ
jgi:RHS repeat-associated protein